MSPDSLPVRLRQARGSMSLAEAAERSGISEERIRMYEEGSRRPYTKTLRRLAEAYDVDVRQLAGEDGPRPSTRTRRRRRRRTDDDHDGQATIEVPVDLSDGEPIRIVLELVIKPEITVRQVPADVVEQQVAEGSEEEARKPAPATPWPEALARVTRPPRDPMDTFRRAYGEFRREKKA